MPQIYDMGPTALLALRRKACWRFFRLAYIWLRKWQTRTTNIERVVPNAADCNKTYSLLHWHTILKRQLN